MLLMSGMTVILFLGRLVSTNNYCPFTWIPGPLWFGMKMCIFVVLFIWARAAFPRYRYDQLDAIRLENFLTFIFRLSFLVAGILVSFGWLPTETGTAITL